MRELLNTVSEKNQTYKEVLDRIWLLIDPSTDWIAAMSTTVSELHTSFEHYDWTGFYRTVRPEHLQIGPYQGTHGCIDIPFSRGVCGAAAREQVTKLVPDVRLFEGHIACSDATLSEIVVPVIGSDGNTIAVLDVDSNQINAFDSVDRTHLEALCRRLGDRFG